MKQRTPFDRQCSRCMNIYDGRSSDSTAFCQLCLGTMTELAGEAQARMESFESGALGLAPKSEHEKRIYQRALKQRRERGDFGKSGT